jgi:hypothetical protein
MKPEIIWKLTVEQANQIMGTLAKRPFDEVADLIAELQKQAQAQLQIQPQQTAMPSGKRLDGEARVQ